MLILIRSSKKAVSKFVIWNVQISKRSSTSLSAQRRQRLERYMTSRLESSSSSSSSTGATQNLTLPASSVLFESSASSSGVKQPSLESLRALFIASAVPMVGFGFMDNIVMIQAGQYIDSTIGLQLGLATLTAAALGQVVSDVSGVLFGTQVERVLSPWIPESGLTSAQRALPLCGNVRMAGAVCGVILGCAMGASSLLFMDLEARERQEKLIQMEAIVDDLKRLHKNFNVHWDHQLSNDPFLKRCFLSRQSIIVHRQHNTSICIPVITNQRVLGVVEYFTQHMEEPTNEDIEKAQILAAHLAIIQKRLD